MTNQDLSQVLNQLSETMKELNGVIISDYNKGVCAEPVLNDIFIKSKELKIPVFVDPKGKRWNKYYWFT